MTVVQVEEPMNKRAIILEGVDKSGKSSLARQIADYFHPHGLIFKSPASQKEWYPLYNSWTADTIERIRPPFIPIFDRVPEISEPVYGGPLRNEIRGQDFICQYDRWNHSPIRKDLLIVYCLPQGDPDDNDVDFDGRPVRPHADVIGDHYRFLMSLLHNNGLTVYQYDFTLRSEPDELMAFIEGEGDDEDVEDRLESD